MSFAGSPTIPVRVGDVKVSLTERNFEGISNNDFLVSPEDVARLWPTERLRKTGGSETLHYLIDAVEARSTRTPEGETVDASLQIQVIIETEDGERTAGAGTRIDSQTHINGTPTEAAREEALYQMSREIATKLDQELVKSFQTRLAPYVGEPLPQSTKAKQAKTQKPKEKQRPAKTAQPAPKAPPQPKTKPSASKQKPEREKSKPLLPQDAWKKGWNWEG